MQEIRDQKYYIDKLYAYAAQFKSLFRERKYPEAKYLYDTALRVSAFLEVPQEVKEKLFGYREENALEEDESEELFPADWVKRCYETCCIDLYQGYEHESYRRYGEPPRYYPQPRYPVAGLPTPDPEGEETARRLLNMAGDEGGAWEERGRVG